MKVKVDKSRLVGAIGMVKDTATGDIAVLKNVKIETLGDGKISLTTTNLDTTVSATVECTVRREGSVTVPVKFLQGAVSVMTSQEVELEYDGSERGKLNIYGGDASFKVSTIPVSEFPIASKFADGSVGFEVSASVLKGGLGKVAYAMSQDKTRREFQSVGFGTDGGKLVLLATDGRRGAKAVVEFVGEAVKVPNISIPDTSMKLIMRMLSGDGIVSVVCDGSSARFCGGNWSVQTKLIDGGYQVDGVNRVIANGVNNAVNSFDVDRMMFTDAVRQASVSAEDECPSIVLNIGQNSIVMTSRNTENDSDAKASLPVKYEGDGAVIVVNPKYILDVLGSSSDDILTMRFKDGGSLVAFNDAEESFNAIVMPLRA